jgi:hypothetical protein
MPDRFPRLDQQEDRAVALDTLNSPTSPSSRRALLAGALGAAAATLASALGRPRPVEATHAGYLQLGHDAGGGVNETTGKTELFTTGSTGLKASASGSLSGTGIWGETLAEGGDAIGVFGRSIDPTGAGVEGIGAAVSGNAAGVKGFSYSYDAAARGVYGEVIAGRAVDGHASGETSGTGVHGDSLGVGAGAMGVHGEAYNGIGLAGWSQNFIGALGQSDSGTGLFGWCGTGAVPTPPDNVAVYAYAPTGSTARAVYGRATDGGTAGYFSTAVPDTLHTGFALRAVGRVRFDNCAGVTTIASGQKTAVVTPNIDLGSNSAVTATLMGSAGGVTTVHRVAVNTSANSFTIVLTANNSTASPVKVAWHVFG